MLAMNVLRRQVTSPRFDVAVLLVTGLACAAIALASTPGKMTVTFSVLAAVNLANAWRLSRRIEAGG